MKSKRDWASILIHLVFGLASVYVLWRWYFPIAHYYLDDEWFVLPERLWFRSAWEWWKHLVFFSQNRITWVGDYMLYRPGLFTWIWFQDVLFREARFGQQIFLVGTAVFTFACFFRALPRECNRGLALAGTLFAFACLRGQLLYVWPHITGYILALAFYVLGAHAWINMADRRGALTSGTLFFLAACFHEFVPISLLAIALSELVFGRRSKPLKLKWVRFFAPAGALALYGLVVLIGYLSFRPPGLFSPTEVDHFQLNADRLYGIWIVTLNLVIQILDDLIPFPLVGSYLDWPRWIVGLGLVGFLFYRTFSSLKTERWRGHLAWAIPLAVLLGGLIVGRIATRGVVKVHYFPIFHFFLMLWFLHSVGPLLLKRKIASLAVAVTLVVGALWNSSFIYEYNRSESATSSAAILKTISDIRFYLQENPDRCFGGVFDGRLRGNFNAAANIALALKNCDWKEGKPAYFSIGPDDSAAYVTPPEPLPPWKSLSLLSALEEPAPFRALADYLIPLTYNIREAELGLRHSGVLRMRTADGNVNAEEVVAGFQSRDTFPMLYNAGVLLQSGSQELYLVLLNNVLKVVVGNKDEPPREVASTPVSSMKTKFELRLVKAGQGCLVFFDQHLLTQIPDCLTGPVQLGVFDFENGTPPEELSKLQYGP